MSNQVPLPPLSSVSDPALRLILKAIYDELRLRRGETGNGDNKFVTQAELKASITTLQSNR